MCDATILGVPDALTCDRTDDHATGHTYTARETGDRHATTEAVDQ